jgi:hypothetical protein
VAFLLTLVTKEVPLRMQSGLQAAAAEDALAAAPPSARSTPASTR